MKTQEKLIKILNLLNNQGYTYNLDLISENNFILNFYNYELNNINIYKNKYYIFNNKIQGWAKINYNNLEYIIIKLTE